MKNEHQSVSGAQSGEDKMRAWLVQFGPVTLREAFSTMDAAELRKQIGLHYPGGFLGWLEQNEPFDDEEREVLVSVAYNVGAVYLRVAHCVYNPAWVNVAVEIDGELVETFTYGTDEREKAREFVNRCASLGAYVQSSVPDVSAPAVEPVRDLSSESMRQTWERSGAWIMGMSSSPGSGPYPSKVSSVNLLGLVDDLRSLLVESHQLERGNDGCDGLAGCSFCQAISRAESVLALSSDPEGMPAPAPASDLAADISDYLRRMAINALPGSSGAARAEAGKLFARVLEARGVATGIVALPPVNDPVGVPSFPVLSFVLDSGGNAVSVECCHSGAHLESIRQNVGNLRLVEVPLALALRAPAMHQALGTISRCIPDAGASDESGENSMIELARRALGLA